MANVTAQEQLMLEAINRARLDPAAEAARLGIDLNKDLPANSIDTTPKPVLAMNDDLVESSRDHSLWMDQTDSFQHEPGRNGTSPTQRMMAAGYDFTGAWSSGENIALMTSSGAINATTAILAHHDGLFRSAGHRLNILDPDFREIGIGQRLGTFDGANASLLTQNFAMTGDTFFVTGVVYADTNNDLRYSIGEGRGNVVVRSTTNATHDVSSAAGGFELGLTPGAKTIAIGGVTVSLTLGQANVKLDLVDGSEIHTSQSLTVVSGATEIHALGIANVALTGAAGSERIFGNGGANTLKGNGGNDVIDGKAGNDVLDGGIGNDMLIGGVGADTMAGGAGNDIYVVDSNSDIADEARAGSSGTDTIRSSISISLATSTKVLGVVEHLTLTGSAALNGTGNGAANAMNGNAAANILIGGAGNDTLLGGAGNDILFGNAGADIFVFNTALNAAANVDAVRDFNVADDAMRLENAIFTALANGQLTGAEFVANQTGLASNSSQHIIYETDTGKLFYDSNGNAAGGATLFATLTAGLALTAADFFVI